MMVLNEEQTLRFQGAVADAEASWTGLDWETGYDVTARELEAVESSAEAAAKEGQEALEYLRRGDIERARRSIQVSVDIENQYGDSPTWGPVMRLLAELEEEVLDDLSAIAQRDAAFIFAHPGMAVLLDLLADRERDGELSTGIEDAVVELTELYEETVTLELVRLGTDTDRVVRALAQEILIDLANSGDDTPLRGRLPPGT